ncbi:MAG: hypothetical protein ABF649_09830, partial [Bacillus sp. (in: firmicutes)]
LFGFSISSFYLIVLIISGLCIFLTLLIADIFSADLGFFNPTLILAFLTILSASGYLLEKYARMNSLLIFGLSAAGAFVVALCLHFFVFIPLSNAEESLGYSDDSLKGRVGKVLTSIPKDGYGEIMIESYSGHIIKTAAGFYNEEIKGPSKIVVIEVKNNIAYVIPQEDL